MTTSTNIEDSENNVTSVEISSISEELNAKLDAYKQSFDAFSVGNSELEDTFFKNKDFFIQKYDMAKNNLSDFIENLFVISSSFEKVYFELFSSVVGDDFFADKTEYNFSESNLMGNIDAGSTDNCELTVFLQKIMVRLTSLIDQIKNSEVKHHKEIFTEYKKLKALINWVSEKKENLFYDYVNYSSVMGKLEEQYNGEKTELTDKLILELNDKSKEISELKEKLLSFYSYTNANFEKNMVNNQMKENPERKAFKTKILIGGSEQKIGILENFNENCSSLEDIENNISNIDKKVVYDFRVTNFIDFEKLISDKGCVLIEIPENIEGNKRLNDNFNKVMKTILMQTIFATPVNKFQIAYFSPIISEAGNFVSGLKNYTGSESVFDGIISTESALGERLEYFINLISERQSVYWSPEKSYQNFFKYNKINPGSTQPIVLLVINNFPGDIRGINLKKIKDIIKYGPSVGIFTVITSDTNTDEIAERNKQIVSNIKSMVIYKLSVDESNVYFGNEKNIYNAMADNFNIKNALENLKKINTQTENYKEDFESFDEKISKPETEKMQTVRASKSKLITQDEFDDEFDEPEIEVEKKQTYKEPVVKNQIEDKEDKDEIEDDGDILDNDEYVDITSYLGSDGKQDYKVETVNKLDDFSEKNKITILEKKIEEKREPVYLDDVLEKRSAKNTFPEKIVVPIGMDFDDKLAELSFDFNFSNLAVIGKNKEEKTEFLHSLILSACVCYTPDEVNFRIMDFDGGVELESYKNDLMMPHIRFIADGNDYLSAFDILKSLVDKMKKLKKLFELCSKDDEKVEDIVSYNNLEDVKSGEYPAVQHTFIIIDEVQKIISKSEKLGDECLFLLHTLLTQGASVGYHFILVSSVYSGGDYKNVTDLINTFVCFPGAEQIAFEKRKRGDFLSRKPEEGEMLFIKDGNAKKYYLAKTQSPDGMYDRYELRDNIVKKYKSYKNDLIVAGDMEKLEPQELEDVIVNQFENKVNVSIGKNLATGEEFSFIINLNEALSGPIVFGDYGHSNTIFSIIMANIAKYSSEFDRKIKIDYLDLSTDKHNIKNLSKEFADERDDVFVYDIKNARMEIMSLSEEFNKRKTGESDDDTLIFAFVSTNENMMNIFDPENVNYDSTIGENDGWHNFRNKYEELLFEGRKHSIYLIPNFSNYVTFRAICEKNVLESFELALFVSEKYGEKSIDEEISGMNKKIKFGDDCAVFVKGNIISKIKMYQIE